MKGELLLRQSLAIEAEESFRAANAIAREQGALFWELRVAPQRRAAAHDPRPP
jgi:hypothetical protein